MFIESNTKEENFPTDAFAVNSFMATVLDFSLYREILLENMDELKRFNLYPQETLPLLLWIARRMTTELAIHVEDYSLNSDMEEFYEEFIEKESNIFIGSLRRVLDSQEFRPTCAQLVVAGSKVFVHLGATDVKLLRK